MANHIVWVDIPVVDLDRAITFYSNVLDVEITNDIPDVPMGVFTHQQGEVAGCLYVASDNQPSQVGALVYLNVQGRLRAAVAAVETHGGKVLESVQQIGPFGYRAVILDSEGNRVALHAATDTPQA